MASYLGIDPGSRNLGYAVLDINANSVTINKLGQIDPKEEGFSETISILMMSLPTDIHQVCIERYVAYKGIHNAASEEILMLIGAMRQALLTDCAIPESRLILTRAIDWKPKLCKHLVKTKDFSNPSTSFDKKYSIAAAECIINDKIESNHIADAICLAYYGYLNELPTKNN